MSKPVHNSTIKRIRNPVTGTYFKIRQRTTSGGNKGTIIGKWSPPNKPTSKKNK